MCPTLGHTEQPDAVGTGKGCQQTAARAICALDDANWLSPFGAEIRYPGDRPEVLPFEELRARDLVLRLHVSNSAVNDAALNQKGRLLKIEVVPLEAHDLPRSQSRTTRDQDHGPVGFPDVR